MRPIDPRLIRSVPALRRLLITLTAIQAVGVILIIAQAGLLADLVVAVFLRHQPAHALVGRLVMLGAVGVSRAVLAGVQEWVTSRASVTIRAQLRASVLDAVVRLGPSGVARQASGRLVTAAGPGLESLDGYVTRAVPAFVAASVIPAAVLLRIGVADWQSGLLLLLVVPLIPVFMWLVGRMTQRHMDRQYATLAKLSGHFLDLVQGLTTLKVYGRARRQVETVRRATETYRKHTMSTLRAGFLSGLVLDLIATLSVAVVAVDIGLRLDHGHLDLATGLVVLFLAPELFAPLRAVGLQHHAAVEGSTAARAALDIIADADEADSVRLGSTPIPAATGAVELRALQLTYPGRTEPALDGLDLALPPGQAVVLQGRSGGGKTTVLSCLLGFVRPDSGSILVGTPDGLVDLTSLDSASWREHVAWVPQRPQLTQPDVASEVALGDPAASAGRVAEAIALCHAPQGGTALGEGASAISAGQCRRVALARALLRMWRQRDAGNVPVLLLDEPSEDLDVRTEQVVASVIAGLSGQATVLFASHSAELAAVADRRVVIADGRVVSDVVQQAERPSAPAPAPAGPALVPVPAVAAVRAARLGDVLGLRGIAKWLTASGALSGATGVAALALTATSTWLICRAAEQPNIQELAIAVVGVRTFAIARALLRYAERLVSHDSALRLLAQVRARVFAALEPLVPAGLGDMRRGDLLRRFVNDVDGVQEGLVRAIVPLVGACITAVAAVTLATLLAPAAGLALAVALGIGIVVAPWLSRSVAGSGERVTALAGRRDASTAALVDGLAELTAYGAERRAVLDVTSVDADLAQAAQRPALGAALGAGVTGTASGLALPMVLAGGALAVSAGNLRGVSVGVLAACVLAGFDALTTVPTAFAAWSRFRAGLSRVAELLARPAPVPEPAVPAVIPAGATGLRAARVTLAPAPDAPVILHDVDLQVCPGERIAIMGPSGSGKSTLLAAVLRLIPATAGEVRLRRDRAAVALRDVRAEDVPPLVAGSLQGDHVFNTSLRDNLRVVRPDATDDDLTAVARRAGLADFVATLPDGWSTPAGPDGAALSGGQRQRLLLARALLADPEVLVLDEPTAHLDAETEREVLRDLLAGTRGRTMLMSTHRRLAADQVDHVLSVDEGTIVTPEEATLVSA